MRPVRESVRPVKESVKPVRESVRPVKESVRPVKESVRPVRESCETCQRAGGWLERKALALYIALQSITLDVSHVTQALISMNRWGCSKPDGINCWPV